MGYRIHGSIILTCYFDISYSLTTNYLLEKVLKVIILMTLSMIIRSIKRGGEKEGEKFRTLESKENVGMI